MYQKFHIRNPWMKKGRAQFQWMIISFLMEWQRGVCFQIQTHSHIFHTFSHKFHRSSILSNVHTFHIFLSVHVSDVPYFPPIFPYVPHSFPEFSQFLPRFPHGTAWHHTAASPWKPPGDGRITVAEFLEGAIRLRGLAKSVDLAQAAKISVGG